MGTIHVCILTYLKSVPLFWTTLYISWSTYGRHLANMMERLKTAAMLMDCRSRYIGLPLHTHEYYVYHVVLVNKSEYNTVANSPATSSVAKTLIHTPVVLQATGATVHWLKCGSCNINKFLYTTCSKSLFMLHGASPSISPFSSLPIILNPFRLFHACPFSATKRLPQIHLMSS